MFRKISTGLSLMFILASFAGCSNGNSIPEEKQIPTTEEIVYEKALNADEYKEALRVFVGDKDSIGATMVDIFDVGDKYTVAATWFGLFILNTDYATLDSYVDLKKYDCNYFQGDYITKVRVDKNQENVYFYNTQNEEPLYDKEVEVSGKVYRFNLESKEIMEIPYREVPQDSEFREMPERNWQEDLEGTQEPLQEVLKQYENTHADGIFYGDKFIFPTAEEDRLTKLKFVFVDVKSGDVKELSVLE